MADDQGKFELARVVTGEMARFSKAPITLREHSTEEEWLTFLFAATFGMGYEAGRRATDAQPQNGSAVGPESFA